MRDETIARLLAVARKTFAEQGFASTSLDALAAEAGLTRGALHHHFGNKTGLFEAVLRRIDAEIDSALDAEWDSEPDKWRAFRNCYHRYLAEALDPARRRIMFEDAPSVLGMKAYEILMDEGLGTLIEDLRNLIAQGRVAPIDPEALAQMLNGAISNLACWAADAPAGEDRLPRAHQTLSMILDGMEAKRR
jgi:AcrR family transcriptional regulator